jgi:hypothetical protein
MLVGEDLNHQLQWERESGSLLPIGKATGRMCIEEFMHQVLLLSLIWKIISDLLSGIESRHKCSAIHPLGVISETNRC